MTMKTDDILSITCNKTITTQNHNYFKKYSKYKYSMIIASRLITKWIDKVSSTNYKNWEVKYKTYNVSTIKSKIY
jgi:hypothetical protein